MRTLARVFRGKWINNDNIITTAKLSDVENSLIVVIETATMRESVGIIIGTIVKPNKSTIADDLGVE